MIVSNILLATLSYNSKEESAQAELSLHYRETAKRVCKAGNFFFFFKGNNSHFGTFCTIFEGKERACTEMRLESHHPELPVVGWERNRWHEIKCSSMPLETNDPNGMCMLMCRHTQTPGIVLFQQLGCCRKTAYGRKVCVVSSSQFHYISSDFMFTESNDLFFPWLLWVEDDIDLVQN